MKPGVFVIMLVKYSETEFGVLSFDPKNTGRGSISQAARALSRMGVPTLQVEKALIAMAKLDHNVSHFSLKHRSFTYSECLNLGEEVSGAA